MKKIVMLLACLVTAFTLTSCGDAPDDVVTKLYKAMGECDSGGIRAVCVNSELAEALILGVNSLPDSERAVWRKQPSIGNHAPEYDGNRASVTRDIVGDDNRPTTETWFLEKIDGRWMIVGAQ